MKQTHTIPKNLGYVCVYFVITYSLCSQTDLYICKAAAGLYHADDKEQYQQGITDCLQRTVDINDCLPYAPAFECFRRLREYLPDFRQFFIPCVQGVLKVLHYPVIRIHCLHHPL